MGYVQMERTVGKKEVGMFNKKLERMKLESSDEVGKFATKLE